MPTLIVKKEKYENEDVIYNVLNYICNSPFTEKKLIGGIGVLGNTSIEFTNHFEIVQKVWNQEDKKRIQHIILTIDSRNEIYDKFELLEIAYLLANFIGQRFQVVFAVHMGSDSNKNHYHIHFAINTISYVDGRRFYGNNSSYQELINYGSNYIDGTVKWKFYYS